MAQTSQGEIIVQSFRGLNVERNQFIIDDTEATIATNVIVNSRGSGD